MNNRTLTSANAIILIQVQGLFDTPQRIQGFSADNITNTDQVDTSETSMGVDGRLSAGYVPAPVRQTIMLQADSLSIDLFEAWDAAQQQTRDLYTAFGQIMLPATFRKYTMTRGFLRQFTRTPSLQKTLQPRSIVLEWERVLPAPFI